MKQTELSYLFDEIDDWIDPVTSNLGIIEKIAKLTSKQSIYPSSEKRTNSKIDINSETFFLVSLLMKRSTLPFVSISKRWRDPFPRKTLFITLGNASNKKSNLCQLSNLTNRIRKKLSTYNFPEGELITSWNKGYFLGDRLYE